MGRLKVYVNKDWLEKNIKAFNDNMRSSGYFYGVNHFDGVEFIIANDSMKIEDFAVIDEQYYKDLQTLDEYFHK